MSNNEGKSSGCSGECPSSCSTGSVQESNLPQRIPMDVNHVILVLSGKGGVGKSTVAVNLSYALSARGYQVGILDLDIHGPNIPKMLGIEDHHLQCEENKIIPVRVTGHLQALSMAFLIEKPSDPVIWRGAMKTTVIRQFLEDTKWGRLDYLIVDLPPGTGDEALTIAQIAPNLKGAVIVTTPQEVATLDSTKAITFVEKLDIPVIGVIENMSGLSCPHCHELIELFGSGGGKKIADEHHVPFLGSIPLDPALRIAGDNGRPFISHAKESATGRATEEVVNNLIRSVE